MADLSKLDECMILSLDLKKIALHFNRALSEKCVVELRLEDSNVNVDSDLYTVVTEVHIDEAAKLLNVDADGYRLRFPFESVSEGSCSASHDKFYFHADNASLTVVVNYKE